MNDPIPVTQTRIILPRRRGDILSRPRLLDILLELLETRLAIIAAPAGYGKTSLLIDFANHIEYPVCWYAIDPLDREPLRFLAHFIAAINHRFPGFGNNSMAALQSATQSKLNIDHLTTTLINDVYENISEHFVIVLDDYHLVDESKQVDQFISRFVQDVDENCHVFIASRMLLTLPDFPLMVARSQVGGLSLEELAFQPQEIQELFLQNYQIKLAPELCKEWFKDTEGWITGLLLSANPQQEVVSKRKRIQRVSGVGLSEYQEQILRQQPGQIQDFLLRSSLLEEFDASLCQDVIGRGLGLELQDWDGLMESALRYNLFVLPVGDQGLWLRYHNLFQDFLQKKMARERPEETQKIRRQLAEMFSRRGDWEKAYLVYHQLGDRVALSKLVEQAGPSLISTGRLETLQNWLNTVSPAMMDARPMLQSLQASIAVLQGDTRQGLKIFDRAVKLLRERDETHWLAQTLVRRSVAHRLAGDLVAALADAEETLRLTESQPELLSVEAEALREMGASYYQEGKLIDALAWMARSLETFRSLEYNQYVSVLLMETGLGYQAMGDFNSAERNYTQALAHWRSTGNSLWQAHVLNNLGFLQHLRGDYETAISTLEKALQHAQIVGVPRLQAFALTSIGDLYRDLQALEEAREAYRQAFEIARQTEDRFLLIYLELANATLDRRMGDKSAAKNRISKAALMATQNGSLYEQCLCDFESGILELSLHQHEQAIEHLRTALDRFEEGGHKIEAARTHLYLTIASYQVGHSNAALVHLRRALSSREDHGKQPALIATG
ncbi:MAG: tetratricopeptide repeat protein, partial [Anaerolineaceae bacterium]|nr:tetratricopeptide repeat protein [Anaerolineaceae bacterium]